MSKALKNLTDEELADHMTQIAQAAMETRLLGGPLPADVVSASVSAAAEASTRWGLT